MATQFARLVMSHIDCDTIPFFWNYANRFTLFDNIFATEDTPSTPNAIAIIGGEAHPAQAGNPPGKRPPPPLTGDQQPFYGSQYDTTPTGRQPDSPSENYGD